MSEPLALFRLAAGARVGHGHLRRAEALAPHLRAKVVVSVRGSGAATVLERVPGASAALTLDTVAPRLLVLDEPHEGHARRWCLAAARRGIPVVSLHDLGLARVPSTLAIDGSITSPARGWTAGQVLRGPAYAIVRRAPRRRGPVRVAPRRVLVSLGGGQRAGTAWRIARALGRRHPDIEVLVASPKVARAAAGAAPRGGVRALTLSAGLGAVLPDVDLAIFGGGLSLYEAAAAGVPAVAIAVVSAQRSTIRGLARAGVVRDAGDLVTRPDAAWLRHTVDIVSLVLRDVAWRRNAAHAGPRLVDGRGAVRAARAIADLLERGTRG